MAREVHSFVQDAQNFYIARNISSEEYDVAITRAGHQVGLEIASIFAECRRCSQGGKSLVEFAEIVNGLI